MKVNSRMIMQPTKKQTSIFMHIFVNYQTGNCNASRTV
ncbi:hypothetical protein [Polaromonas sp. CG9_12]|nr:hypothetical protein [Polaromonas sp. CG9_12]